MNVIVEKLVLRLAIVLKLVLSILICWYFWSVNDLEGIQQLPMYVLVLCVVYIGLQMITRRISKAQHWWDWVYYAGLLCIMIPVMFSSEKTLVVYNVITDIGTLLLVLPVLVDGWILVKPNSVK
jgi:hypothetical protein